MSPPPQCLQHLLALAGEAVAKERREGWGRYKVPSPAELAGPRHIVAEARGIEGKFHEPVKGHSPPIGLGLSPDKLRQALAVPPCRPVWASL